MTQIVLPVPPLSYPELKAILSNELTKKETGYFCTIRGIARLIGLSASSLVDRRLQLNGVPRGVFRRLIGCSPNDLPDSLKPAAGFDYKQSCPERQANSQNCLIPEVVISCIIKYYAYDCLRPLERAKQLDAMFSSVGVRALFEKVLEGQQPATPFVESELQEELEQELAPTTTVFQADSIKDALNLIHKLESYRVRREEVVAFFYNLGMFSNPEARNTTYRGVVKHKDAWRAQISVNGATRPLGTYVTPEEAAKAYDSYAKVIYGDKARLNF